MATSTTRGDATRARVVEAAAAQIADGGLESLRGPAVAAAAGVSEATVWHHFGTKHGLLVAVMEAYYDGLVDDLRAAIDAASSPLDRLATFARFWLHRMAADLPLVGEFSRHGRQGHAPEVVAAFAACNRRVTRRFERVVEDLAATGELRRDVPPHVLRDAFFGTAEHVLVGGAVTGRQRDLDAAATLLLDLLLDGARPRAGDDAPTLASIDAKLDTLLRRDG